MSAAKNDKERIVDFLFEVGILSKTPRSGFYFLGSGDQSVAEHLNRVMFIGYALAMQEKNVDTTRILKMCLFHDLPEGRTSDLNYVHQKYANVNERKVVEDMTETLPFGADIKAVWEEYVERKTRESIIAKDADILEWILSLKEQVDTGNVRAKEWITVAAKRLKTDNAKKLVPSILKTESDHWWFSDKNDSWWVSRNKEK
ncbi:MAG: HD domain-containing protein [Candidatus Lloydbacteria bacterium]|nr:HD domain-containing protein [Candidatus Lloydbacteria bacterium]